MDRGHATERSTGWLFFFDRTTKKLSRLFDEYPALTKSYARAEKAGRDQGTRRTRVGELPDDAARVCRAKNLPLVLLIHGGPWFRDYDRFRSGGAAVGQPWLCRPAGELPRLDRLWAEVSKRRD